MPLLQSYENPPAALLRHPLLLVDTAQYGPCSLTTVGWFMNHSRWTHDAPFPILPYQGEYADAERSLLAARGSVHTSQRETATREKGQQVTHNGRRERRRLSQLDEVQPTPRDAAMHPPALGCDALLNAWCSQHCPIRRFGPLVARLDLLENDAGILLPRRLWRCVPHSTTLRADGVPQERRLKLRARGKWGAFCTRHEELAAELRRCRRAASPPVSVQRPVRLPASRELRAASGSPAPLPSYPPSQVLLGVVSVSAGRRAAIRCTWGRRLRTLPARLLFVIGQPAHDGHATAAHADEVVVPIEEGLLMPSAHRPATRTARGATYSSLSAWLKVRHFIGFAATQPEPFVGLADDDVFIEPSMLLAYVTVLRRKFGDAADVGAGSLEWYSWREDMMVPTGWAHELGYAQHRARQPWRQCSPPTTTSNLSNTSTGCVGPFPFMKGPLLLLSSSVVRWLHQSETLARDAQRVALLAMGTVRAYSGAGSGRIPHDAHLGYLLAQHPSLHLVEVAIPAWCDRWRSVGDLRKLLAAHRVPWDRLRWLDETTGRLWDAAGGRALGRVVSLGPVCYPGECAVAPGQTHHQIEVATLEPTRPRGFDASCVSCSCWRTEEDGILRTWSNGSCAAFSRALEPSHLCDDG